MTNKDRQVARELFNRHPSGAPFTPAESRLHAQIEANIVCCKLQPIGDDQTDISGLSPEDHERAGTFATLEEAIAYDKMHQSP
jgi:hypothetical protein